MLVSICIGTYQRSGGLTRLLEALNNLTFSKCDAPDIEVIVVDNDQSGSAKEICANIEPHFKWLLKYDIEPQRGIPYVRNKAVSFRNPQTDFVAFIDDDEVPLSNWLDELLYVQKQLKADVVAGAVLPYFIEKDTPTWAEKGRFFEYSRFPTGHSLEVAFTNNVIVSASIFQKMNKIFDNRFALSGGEDSHFFMRVYRMGYKMVWANDALVYEWVPKSRINIGWVLRRGFRTWSTHSLVEKELEPSLKVQTIRMLKGSGLIMIGLLLLLPSLLSKHQLISALLKISRGLGTFSGLIGWHLQEYQTVHKV